MTAPVFVDTNVLIYRFDDRDPTKQEVADAWLRYLWRARLGRLSVQVLQEFYVTVTAKLSPGLPPDQARKVTRTLLAWDPVSTDGALIESAWLEQDRYGFSWWDSLIVAAARASGSATLLTEDLQHGQQLGSLQVIDPFQTDPPSSP